MPGNPAEIDSIFSGASVTLSRSVSADDFDEAVKGDDGFMDTVRVFVIVALVQPDVYAVVTHENYLLPDLEPKHTTVPYDFSAIIDEGLRIACDEEERLVAVKPPAYKMWTQFWFEHDFEYWEFLTSISRAKAADAARQERIHNNIENLSQHFREHFKPQVYPYNDPKELALIRRMGEGADMDLSDAEESDALPE